MNPQELSIKQDPNRELSNFKNLSKLNYSFHNFFENCNFYEHLLFYLNNFLFEFLASSIILYKINTDSQL
jgi:hypothetical protein